MPVYSANFGDHKTLLLTIYIMEKHLTALKNEATILEKLKAYKSQEHAEVIKKLIDNIEVDTYTLDNTWNLKKAFTRIMDSDTFNRDLRIEIGDYLDARTYFELAKK